MTFPRHEERRNPDEAATLVVEAASPGFLTLSTPFALHDLPGLFHPGSAYGVLPSRYVRPAMTR
jgi:hypothetical protein